MISDWLDLYVFMMLAFLCRSLEHNEAAIKGDKPVEYEEYAILKDGTEVGT